MAPPRRPLPTESHILTTLLLPPASPPLSSLLPYSPNFTALFPPPRRATAGATAGATAARASESHPSLPRLYAALHHARAAALDAVRDNVAAECARGRGTVREVVRVRARDGGGRRMGGGGGGDDHGGGGEWEGEGDGDGMGMGMDMEMEMGMDTEMGIEGIEGDGDVGVEAGEEGGSVRRRGGGGVGGGARRTAAAHTAASAIRAMEDAVADLETEVHELEGERDGLQAEARAVVEGLSDLRYARRARPGGNQVGGEKAGARGAGEEMEEVLELLRELEREVDLELGLGEMET